MPGPRGTPGSPVGAFGRENRGQPSQGSKVARGVSGKGDVESKTAGRAGARIVSCPVANADVSLRPGPFRPEPYLGLTILIRGLSLHVLLERTLSSCSSLQPPSRGSVTQYGPPFVHSSKKSNSRSKRQYGPPHGAHRTRFGFPGRPVSRRVFRGADPSRMDVTPGGGGPRTVADARCWSLGSPLAAVGPGRRVGPVPGGITAWHYRALVSVVTSLPETRAPNAGSRHPTGRPDKRPTAPPTIGSRKAYTEPVSDGRWCSAIGTSPVGSA